MNNAIALNIQVTSTKVEVDLAKDAISAYQNAPSKVLDKVTVNTTTLKHLVAAYDFKKYYDEVLYPAYLKGLYAKTTDRPEILQEEVPYAAKMFMAMDTTGKSNYNTQFKSILVVANLSLSPNLNMGLSPYDIENVNNPLYDDYAYNYEKEFKYSRSLNITNPPK